jgi:hypothetical protein
MGDTRKGCREQPAYLSYLLRLWQVNGGRQGSWRASLKSASSGEQLVFASLEELFDYVRAQTTVESQRPES